jgi:hypothetical protein
MTVTIGRRELLAALGGAAAAWPLAAHGQQAKFGPPKRASAKNARKVDCCIVFAAAVPVRQRFRSRITVARLSRQLAKGNGAPREWHRLAAGLQPNKDPELRNHSHRGKYSKPHARMSSNALSRSGSTAHRKRAQLSAARCATGSAAMRYRVAARPLGAPISERPRRIGVDRPIPTPLQAVHGAVHESTHSLVRFSRRLGSRNAHLSHRAPVTKDAESNARRNRK